MDALVENDAPLAWVGVDTVAERAYRLLLSRDSTTVDDVVAALGVTADEGLAVLEQLHHAGLMSRRSSGEFFTVDPRHALHALVESRERRWPRCARRPARWACSSTRPGGPGTAVPAPP